MMVFSGSGRERLQLSSLYVPVCRVKDMNFPSYDSA